MIDAVSGVQSNIHAIYQRMKAIQQQSANLQQMETIQSVNGKIDKINQTISNLHKIAKPEKSPFETAFTKSYDSMKAQRFEKHQKNLQLAETKQSSSDDKIIADSKNQAAKVQTYKQNQFDSLIKEAANRTGLDEKLIRAVIQQESNWNTTAVSHAGARGLMQLMPATARSLGVSNSFDPAQNIEGGTRYLKGLMDQFGDVRLALAAYNAGPARVHEYNGIPPFKETMNYVDRIYKNYQTALNTERMQETDGGFDQTVE
jgi:soluble lytic murein transglycosylase-like protein